MRHSLNGASVFDIVLSLNSTAVHHIVPNHFMHISRRINVVVSFVKHIFQRSHRTRFSKYVCWPFADLLLSYQHYPRTNGRSGRYNKMIIDQLRHYIEECQRGWEGSIKSLLFGSNMQVHGSTSTAPFRPTLTREPRGSENVVPPTFGNKTKNDDSLQKPNAVIPDHTNLLKTKTVQVLKRPQEAYYPSLDERFSRQAVLKVASVIYLCKNPNIGRKIISNDTSHKIQPKKIDPEVVK